MSLSLALDALFSPFLLVLYYVTGWFLAMLRRMERRGGRRGEQVPQARSRVREEMDGR